MQPERGSRLEKHPSARGREMHAAHRRDARVNPAIAQKRRPEIREPIKNRELGIPGNEERREERREERERASRSADERREMDIREKRSGSLDRKYGGGREKKQVAATRASVNGRASRAECTFPVGRSVGRS